MHIQGGGHTQADSAKPNQAQRAECGQSMVGIIGRLNVLIHCFYFPCFIRLLRCYQNYSAHLEIHAIAQNILL